jgi:hypothetical protein
LSTSPRGGADSAPPATRASDRDDLLAFDAGDILHLLWNYQAILSHRPIERGNRAYLAALVEASRLLATALDSPGRGADPLALDRLRAALRTQNVLNAQSLSRGILPLIRACAPNAGARTSNHDLYLTRTRRPLRAVDQLVFIFGPGLGLGDEIACLQFVRQVTARFGSDRATIFSCYPGLWPLLMPNVRSRHYWANPLRPYRAARLSASARTVLMVAIDFDGNGLHHAVLPRAASIDVLEIAIGLRRGWLRRGDSPWVETVETFAEGDVGNYEWLHAMWNVLDPGAPHRPSWESLVSERPKRTRRVPTVFLNPLSSKPVPWNAGDWTAIFRELSRVLGTGEGLRVSVYPGVDDASAADARSIVAALKRLPHVEADLLGQSLTPYSGMRAIEREMIRADVCVTIDTFTAHLAPLFRVPTVVMALKENRAFWVPCPWSFYVQPAEVMALVPSLIASLLTPQRFMSGGEVGERVRRATAAIGETAEPGPALAALIAALALLVGRVDLNSPLVPSGRQWIHFWSRVGAAVRRAPVATSELSHFVSAWKASTFYRLFVETR